MTTGEAIRRARSSRGLTQIELAARAGISRQALGAIEAGSYQPGVAIALSLVLLALALAILIVMRDRYLHAF